MENAKRVRDIYLSTKPITAKIGSNNMKLPLRSSNQYSHYFHENIHQQKQNNWNKNKNVRQKKSNSKEHGNAVGIYSLEHQKQENQKLRAKIKELQSRINDNKLQHHQSDINNQVCYLDGDKQMLRLLQTFTKKIELLQERRLQKLRKQVTEQQSAKWRNEGELTQDVDISPKSIILAIIMEFSQMYKKIPDNDVNGELEEIYNANQEMFIAVINNKIRLNEILRIN